MRILIAPDSFKGSVSAREAAEAIRQGLAAASGEGHELICLPIADGGEGTLEALVAREHCTAVSVTGPMGKPTEASYGYVGDVAVIEMASAAGLTLVEEQERRAASATTRGVGELMLHALRSGYRRLMLTVGGSATNDGGCGLLAALGGVFRDAEGKSFLPTGGTLSRISEIDLSGVEPLLLSAEITVASDVKNPLLGATGATMVYGRQKGASEEELLQMERGMAHYAALLEAATGRQASLIPGSGAGGGIALPLLSLTSAVIRSGIETVLEVNGFESLLQGADLVITGEGRLDAQSLFGKAVSGVANAARRVGVPVACLAGCLGATREELAALGIDRVKTVDSLASSPEDSMRNAARYLRSLAAELAEELLATK